MYRQWGKGFGVLLMAASFAMAQEVAPAKGSSAAEAVVISLLSNSTVASPRICIRDVATFAGGIPELRQRIANLDLADFPSGSQLLHVNKEQVFYRLRVSDIDQKSYRIEGAAQATVNLSAHQVTDEDILATAKQCLVARLPGKPEDISIQLLQPLRGPRPVHGKKDDIHLEAEVHSASR